MSRPLSVTTCALIAGFCFGAIKYNRWLAGQTGLPFEKPRIRA